MNVKLECDNLDAFLADALSQEVTSQFALHLDHCEECRNAVDEQRWIDGLLRSNSRVSLEPAPDSLRESFRAAAAPRRHQNTQLIACCFAAVAAAVVVAVGWTLTLSRQADEVAAGGDNGTTNETTISQSDVRPAVAQGTQRPKATFIGTGDAIAVPIESSDDNVTVVQLYPTTDTERRLRRELALQFTHSEPNGG